MSKRSDNHALVQIERELAEDSAKTSLESYSHPLKDGWREMQWDYLRDVYPGKEETWLLRKCWKYAVARGLITVGKGYRFRFKATS